ncbi:CPBP family intramembrane glutamic endopeptidase [Clostridium taeniosporum]|uniref:CPBP family intramembrane metalloprotease n=1 Tax=Clostridium taeniosporum TaxID=394958 RepID=A0A1D7XIV8_9CLOT|nr:CPBP family intramembrane glutamic endopeptidase [Clostridium taeniosporum]AOR23120.1 CPBP family intramembrane metalloprotease [Clostridium taeniosporum]
MISKLRISGVILLTIVICYSGLFMAKKFGITEGIITNIILYGSMLISTFIFLKIIDKKSFESIGLRSQKGLKKYCIALAIIAIIPIGISFLFNGTINFKKMFPLELIKIALFNFMVGFSEEFFVRGYIYSAINNEKLKIPLSAALFSLLHIISPEFNFMLFILLFLIGIFFALAFYFIKNLWPLIIFHSVWNIFTNITDSYQNILISLTTYIIMIGVIIILNKKDFIIKSL